MTTPGYDITQPFRKGSPSGSVAADLIPGLPEKLAEPVFITVDQPASADSQNTLDLDRGEVRATFAIPNPATPNTADFTEYTTGNYLGARYSRPPIGASAENSRGVQTSVDVGVWLYLIADNTSWVVELGADLATKEWVQRDIDLLVPGDGNFRGRYPDGNTAVGHIQKDDDFYYDTSHAELRVASNFVAGIVTFNYVHVRLLNARDLTHFDGLIQALQDAGVTEVFNREHGDTYDVASIGTADEYSAALARHIADPDSEVIAQVLWLNITSDIAGAYQSEADQAPVAYNWAAGDVVILSLIHI